LIWADRPIMMNSVLEGLRQRRLDDIFWEIWLTTERICAIEVEKRPGEKIWIVGCHPHRDDGVMSTYMHARTIHYVLAHGRQYRRVVRTLPTPRQITPWCSVHSTL